MSAKTVSPISVANYLLENGNGLDQLKLIKLVYLCHGWHLAVFGKPLVNEGAQAWPYGPVFPSIYRATNGNGKSPIKYRLGDGKPANLSAKQKKLVGLVLKKYKPLSGVELMRMSHKEGTPWDKVWIKHGDDRAEIGDDLIQRHYEALLTNAQ